MKLTNIEINNFRGIKHASIQFPCGSRIICLIGSGDSCKSTILKAIEWVLWPSWSLISTDTDFYNCNPNNSIVIEASITEVPDDLMKENKFGLYLRDYEKSFTDGDDEPTEDGITILTIRLTIDSTLEPKWEVITNRTEPKIISQRDRRLLSFGTVGFEQDKDFQWGRGSILQKYADSKDALHNAFTQAMRNAVANTSLVELDKVAETMIEIGGRYGVSFNGDIQNHILMQNGSYSTTVGVFDDKVPFAQRGLGSKRLLSIGMNVNAYKDGTLVLVDEVETGLEPYRIIALINEFRKQFKNLGQLIMTTHSRSAVCECSADELCVVNTVAGETTIQPLDAVTEIKEDIQAIIRREPDALLCKRIVVCEGKTEIGLLRAFDDYLTEKSGTRFAHFGVGTALGGGGDQFFTLAKFLKKCGYDVCILMDSDVENQEEEKNKVEALGIPVFSWDKGFAIEEQIFHDFSIETIETLIMFATEEKSFDHVIAKMNNRFCDDEKIHYISEGGIRIKDNATKDQLTALGKLAKDNNWFKRIDRGQRVGEIIFADFDKLEDRGFKTTINALKTWVTANETR